MTPTPLSRRIGSILFVLVVLAAMALAGAVEGHAASDPRNRMYHRQVVVWRSLSALDKSYYCSMPRREAVLVWMVGIAESSDWKFTDRDTRWASRKLFHSYCP
jgi:hypothetical protein